MPGSRSAFTYARGAAAVFAVAVVAALVLPPYYAGLVTLAGLYALVVIGLNVFMGYAGQVSLGQAAFLALGAYTSALLALRVHVSPWLGLVCGSAVAAFGAYVLSFVVLRLREHLLALGTLALGIVAGVVFNEWDFAGGTSGLKDIPGFALGSHVFDVRGYAVFAWLLVALGACFAGNLVRSTYGRTLIAVASGEIGAAMLGVNAERLKRQVFVLSAAYAGAAGAVYASYASYIDATSFGFLLSVNFVLMSVIGGSRSIFGAVLGACVVVALGSLLQTVVPLVVPSARGDFQSFFLGVILIAILIVLPNGITGALQARRA